jgi:hypothetical protein
MEAGTPVFGVIEIEPTCTAPGCNGHVVAAFPVRTREAGTSIWWLCDAHAKRMPIGIGQAGSHAGGQAREVTRTCGLGDEDVPCGALATHVAVVGVRDASGNPELGIVSVCQRHRELVAP